MLEAILSLPPVILLMFILTFIGGLATIPILAYGVGDLLPGFIAEPLANILLILACFGMQNPTLEQTESGEYVITEGEGDLNPEEYWSRFALSRFGITAQMTEAAWNTLALDPRDIDTELISGASGWAKVATLSRGGKQWCTKLGQRAAFVLPIGQVLSVFQNSAGLGLAVDAAAQGEKEHGGDTSSFSPKMRLMGGVLFTAMGLGMGVFFFVL